MLLKVDLDKELLVSTSTSSVQEGQRVQRTSNAFGLRAYELVVLTPKQ
jgi:hypothetical protein